MSRYSDNSRKTYEATFLEAYKKLNPQQKAAVDQIDGPIMALAGPGTGKTQIIALRIGKILMEIDVLPQNILCLTFTDAATIAMRNRLVEMIGPTGHQVHIFTFHSFCNQVIQENLGIFGDYRQLEPVSELESIDIYREIIDELEHGHILKRLKGDIYFETKRMKNLYDMMKKEYLSTEIMQSRISEYLNRIKDSDEFIAKRKTTTGGRTFMKGDFRDDKYQKEVDKFAVLQAAVDLFDVFKQKMNDRDRYDYNDMILWVLEKFESYPDLLSHYQEKYQYFLVDEYQDTNGAQDKILRKLIDFWPNPNVFVVGDDDQAIYKFQGANLNNLRSFIHQYSVKPLVLVQNYRSSQNILDLSAQLINFNKERIIYEDPSLSKDLVSAGEARHSNLVVKVCEYENVVHEQASLIEELVSYHKGEQKLEEIAIIYRKHAQVEKLVKVLEEKGIPLNIKKKIDILKIPLIQNIFNILHYLFEEYTKPDQAEHRLFEIMHYHFFHINPRDIAKLSMACASKRQRKETASWRDLMADKEALKELNIESVEDIIGLHNLLSKWTADIANVTLQTLYEEILNEGQILNYILQHPNRTWLLQIVTSLFDQIKNETTKDAKFNLSDFLEMIDKMEANTLPLEINKIVHAENGINFLTAHGAKGLEFEKVYMIGCTKNIWDQNKSNSRQYKYPDNVNADVQTNTEDERRLFYVAMTRAKTDLRISYSSRKENGKDLGASLFVDELLSSSDSSRQKISVASEVVDDFNYYILLRKSKKVQLIDHDLIDLKLQGFVLSVTGLNKYLHCPMSFYFDQILQVPTARNASMGFGRAVHRALQLAIETYEKNKEVKVDQLLAYFEIGMNEHSSHFTEKEFEDRMVYGKNIMTGYFEEYFTSMPAKAYETEVPLKNAHYQGIPIKGFIDKVAIFENYIEVTDFKTGDYTKSYTKEKLLFPGDKLPQGGDYWRQIVFYKMLVDNDKTKNWDMRSGWIDFVEPDKASGKYKQVKYAVSQEMILQVGDQIVDVWDKIHRHEFGQLCEDENCYWCNFVSNDYVFLPELVIETEDEIQDF
jgi:DNA helicase-2/ATP-dependent DNA helicase PcrA